MNTTTDRPLSLLPLRTFEAVARRLSFSGAADELALSQPAVSRQIKGLEAELGTALFARGTRHVELTEAGRRLSQQVAPLLEGLDRCVRELRQRQGRRQVSVSAFVSFVSLWLLPRLAHFQQQHADIDVRVSADDRLLDADAPDQDLLLRFGGDDVAPPHAERLFGEVLTPVVSPLLMAQARAGQVPPLRQPADLAAHTLLEDDVYARLRKEMTWSHWLQSQQLAGLEPRRWVYLNYSHQMVQAAAAGQGVALARLPLVYEALERGDLVEPFGPARRIGVPLSYWLIPVLGARLRPELRSAIAWVRQEAERTRQALVMPPAHQSDARQPLARRRRRP